VLVAALIGVSAVIGSVTAWRAEEASRAAEHADRRGIGDRVADQRARAEISADLQNIFFDYVRAQAARARAQAIAAELRRVPADDRDRLAAEAAADNALSREILDGIDADAFRNGRDTPIDLTRKFQIEYRLAQQSTDLDPTPEFDEAHAQRTKSERLVGLTALLIVAAFFFTLAQVLRRGPTRLYVVSGLAVLVASASLLVVLEVSA
jgi:hypothetical protein